jgi:hypothetical protein
VAEITLEPGEHRGLVKMDGRGRFPLRSFASREPIAEWKVYDVYGDGRTLVLQAVLTPGQQS